MPDFALLDRAVTDVIQNVCANGSANFLAESSSRGRTPEMSLGIRTLELNVQLLTVAPFNALGYGHG